MHTYNVAKLKNACVRLQGHSCTFMISIQLIAVPITQQKHFENGRFCNFDTEYHQIQKQHCAQTCVQSTTTGHVHTHSVQLLDMCTHSVQLLDMYTHTNHASVKLCEKCAHLVRVCCSNKNRPCITLSPLYWPRLIQLTDSLYDFIHFSKIVPRRAAFILHLQCKQTSSSLQDQLLQRQHIGNHYTIHGYSR